MTTLDYSKITDIRLADIDMKDYPDFCDAYISNANYEGEPMTGEQLDELNEDYDFVYQSVMKHLF